MVIKNNFCIYCLGGRDSKKILTFEEKNVIHSVTQLFLTHLNDQQNLISNLSQLNNLPVLTNGNGNTYHFNSQINGILYFTF